MTIRKIDILYIILVIGLTISNYYSINNYLNSTKKFWDHGLSILVVFESIALVGRFAYWVFDDDYKEVVFTTNRHKRNNYD